MRRRILLLVAVVTTLVVLAFAIPVALLVRSAVVQRSERSMRDQAEAVSRFLGYGNHTSSAIISYLNSLPQNKKHSTSVQLPAGTVLGTDRTPEDGPPHSDGDGGPPGGGGGGGPGAEAQLHSVTGGEMAELSLHTAGGGTYVIRVFTSHGALTEGVGRWYALLAAGSAGMLLIGIIGGELVTRRIVRPLVRTAYTAQQLSKGDVDARAPTSGPREVAEVGSALNLLADRIDELIAEERETVADISHRMRTPLTALRLDAEGLRDADEAERIGTHVTALERTLTAVIRAARRPQREGRLPSADATAVVADRVAFWSALADDQERSRSISLPDAPLPVRASAEDLSVAVDALLENVIAHTPEGTAFAVSLSPGSGSASGPGPGPASGPGSGGGATLVVTDDGPGLPDGAGVRGRSDRGSSGLGLDIARQCAEASDGSMRVGRSASGGASVTLYLRAP
jgi:signal transduction histidine kinase